MKAGLLVLAVTLMLVTTLSRCNSHSGFRRSLTDTTVTLAQYEIDIGAIVSGYLKRVSRDTFTVTNPDTKVKWIRDTSYIIVMRDTLRNRDNRPIFDSLTKKPRFHYFSRFIPRRYVVQDYNINPDNFKFPPDD